MYCIVYNNIYVITYITDVDITYTVTCNTSQKHHQSAINPPWKVRAQINENLLICTPGQNSWCTTKTVWMSYTIYLVYGWSQLIWAFFV